MKTKVILTQRYQQEAIRQLEESYELIIASDENKSLKELLEAHPETEALISFLSDPVDREIIDLGKNLKIIANYAVGYNNVDVSYAIEKKLPVTNTPDVLTEATADFAMALLLAVARHVVKGDAFTRAGRFEGWGANLMLGKHLYNSSIGIVGMGRIGQATAFRAKSFGMKVLYYSRTRKMQLEKDHDFHYLPFDELLKTADVISLHLPSSPQTHHLIGAKQLNQMKPDAIFINVSRGDLVDEIALADKLERKELFGAGLDVYEYEPNVTEKLKNLENVVLAPHLGSATYTARMGMAQMTIDNVAQVFRGEKPQNLVKECSPLYKT